LKAIYTKESLNVYDYTVSEFSTAEDVFPNTKCWADQLVREKLAFYFDPEHTTMQLTNFGKYWIMRGGYDIFLREGQSTKKHHRGQNDDSNVNLIRKEKEELIEARLKLTHYRLVAFWLTIIIAAFGFLLSLYNLFLITRGKK
jgi:hypothetical protein